MHKLLLLIPSVALIALAGWLTFFDTSRYGTHGDGFECGEVKDTVLYTTATAYYLFTQSHNTEPASIGTCPYDTFRARTFALDLWTPAIPLGYLTYKSSKPRT